MAGRAGLGTLVVRLDGDSTKFEKMLDQATRKIEGASAKFSQIGSTMTRSLTLPLVAVGAVAIKSFSDFDDAMTKSLSIMGNLSTEMKDALGAEVMNVARNSRVAQKDLAEGLFFLSSAGFDAVGSMQALSKVEAFAAAGAFGMAKATDLLTDAQSALGLVVRGDNEKTIQNMVRLSDVLIKANTLANTNAQQISEALVNKSGTALKLLNKDVEEGAAVLAVFADAGIKSTQAGEKLNIVLRDLQTAALKKSKVWKKLGLAVFDSGGKMRRISDIIRDLDGKFSKMTDRQKKATATMLGFQDRSFSAIKTLLGTSDQIDIYEKMLRKAGGTTQEVRDKQMKSFAAQMAVLRNRFTEMAIEIGKALIPALTFLGKQLAKVTKWWGTLTTSAKQFLVVAGALIAFVGPAFKLMAFLTGAWGIKILLIVGAAALVVDAILQMTGQGKLGITELIGATKIGNKTISESSQSTMVKIGKGWIGLGILITQVWVAIGQGVGNAMSGLTKLMIKGTGRMIRGMLRMAKIANNLNPIGDGKGRTATLNSMIKALDAAENEALRSETERGEKKADVFRRTIQNLDLSLLRTEEKAARLQKGIIKEAADKVKKAAPTEDLSAKMKRLEAQMKKSTTVNKQLTKSPLGIDLDAILRGDKLGKKDKDGDEFTAAEKAAQDRKQRSEFRVMSRSQFALKPIAKLLQPKPGTKALTPPKKKTQEVSDKGVVQVVEKIASQLRNSSFIARLG